MMTRLNGHAKADGSSADKHEHDQPDTVVVRRRGIRNQLCTATAPDSDVTASPRATCDLTSVRAWRIWEAGITALIAVAALVRLPRSWTVLGDNALMRMWTHAVGTSATPLVGGDARFGWNHLGPWLFYLMAIPYRLLAASAVGLLVGAAIINIGCLFMAMRCVRSVAGERAGAIVAAGAVLFLLTATGDRLIDPWNPYVVQLPFLLALVCCWAVVNRHWQWFAWLVGAGSLCVQAHIAFLVPVVVLVIAAAIALIRSPSSETLRAAKRAGIVGAIAWLPSFIDLFTPGGHNVYRVARFFTRPSHAPTGGLSAGSSVVLRETGFRASWLGGHLGLRLFTDGFDGGVGLLPGAGIVVLFVAAILTRRRKDAVVGSLVAILAMLLPFAVVEMALGRGELYPYLFGWVTIVGMMCWAVGLMAVLPSSRMPILGWAIAAFATALAAILLLTGFAAQLPRSPRERPQDAAIVRHLVTETEPKLSHTVRYQLEHGGDAFSSIYELGVVNSLRHDGYSVTVEPRERVLFGRHMIDAHACNYPALAVIAPYEAVNPGDQLLALSDPLTPAQRAQEAALVTTLTNNYQQAGSPNAANVVRFAEGDLVLMANFVHPDSQQQPLLQQLAALRKRGRAIAVVIHDTPTVNACSMRIHARTVPLVNSDVAQRRLPFFGLTGGDVEPVTSVHGLQHNIEPR